MPGRNFRLQDYAAYLARVGDATYVDCTRRTDPARAPRVWENLRAVAEAYGPPWILQIWTKNPRGVMELGGALLERLCAGGTTITCQLTVTGLGGTELEPRAPADALGEAGELLECIGGPAHCAWRFDPAIAGLDNTARFEALAPRAAALGIKRLVVNFACDPGVYARVDARLAAVFPYWRPGLPGIEPGWKERTAREIAARAAALGLAVFCCAEGKALREAVPDLEPPECGSFTWFCALSGRTPGRRKGRPSRRGCGCADYFDVGCYGNLRACHGCLYCYAG